MGHTRDEIAAVEDPFCLYPAVELALRSFELHVFYILYYITRVYLHDQ